MKDLESNERAHVTLRKTLCSNWDCRHYATYDVQKMGHDWAPYCKKCARKILEGKA